MSLPDRYRKKPVEIEAVQFDGTNAQEIAEWTGEWHPGDIPWSTRCDLWEVATLKGTMRANPGDWIIRGVAGEFYPCRDDIFQQTYELVL